MLLTGTPEGVGKLSAGDLVEVEVDGVGTLANPVERAVTRGEDGSDGRGVPRSRRRRSGSLHVGNVRTGLFSWAFARHHGGAFILRIEDTDASRVTEEAFHGVMDSLRWLGIDWDEGPDVGGPHEPYRQSQRMRHLPRDDGEAARAGRRVPLLLHGGGARGAAERREGARRGPGLRGPVPRPHREERAAFEAEGRPHVVRFRMPEREWVTHDLVKGEVRWKAGHLSDFVLVRSDGSPVFLLAVAVDDLLMGVTHVVRGDDLLASAPRNAAVIEALGGTPARVRARAAGERRRTASRCPSGTARRASRRSASRGSCPRRS